MSILGKAIGDKVITPVIKSCASFLPGQIIGIGEMFMGTLPTYNVKVYNGDINIKNYNSYTILKNIPISSLSSTTQSISLQEGDEVLLGKLNNDENSLVILNGGKAESKNIKTGGDGTGADNNKKIDTQGDASNYGGKGNVTTGNTDVTLAENGNPVWGTATSSFDMTTVFIRGDEDDPIPVETTWNGKTYKTGQVYTYMNWKTITSYNPDKSYTEQTSLQARLRKLAVENGHVSCNSSGFWMIGTRFVVAMTDWYAPLPAGDNGSYAVGSVCDICLRDGSVIPVIIGDIKSRGDSGRNNYGHMNGACIVEFITDWADGHDNVPYGAGVEKVINGGRYFDNTNLVFVKKIKIPSLFSYGTKIFIDPGHDNKSVDPGVTTSNKKENESDLVFDLAEALRNKLILNGYVVKMSKDTKDAVIGTTVDESAKLRASMAKEFQADLIVSLHCYNKGIMFAGPNIYYDSKKGGDSIKANNAKLEMEKDIKNVGVGIMNYEHKILKNTTYPGLLIEVGNISNPDDLKLIKDVDKYSTILSKAIEKAMSKTLSSLSI